MRAIAIAALTVGCMRPLPAQPSPPLGPSGTATITCRSALGWPYRAESTLLALDGALIENGSHVAVMPGNHTVTLRATLTVPCTALSSKGSSRIVIRALHAFSAGTDAAGIGAEIYERGDVSLPIEDRLAVRFRLNGARDGVPTREPLSAKCVALKDIEREVCVLDARIERARADRDIIRLLCLDSKRKLVQSLLPAVDDAVRNKIRVLAREAEECVGEDLGYVGQTEVTVEDRCGRPIDVALGGPPIEEPIRVVPFYVPLWPVNR